MADADASPGGRHRLTLRAHHSPAVATTITIEGELSDPERRRLETVLVDPLLETATWNQPVGARQLDVGLIPGVTDTEAAQVMHAASLLGIAVQDAAVGRLINLDDDLDDREIRRHYTNAVIERWAAGSSVEPGYAVRETTVSPTELIELPTTDEGLTELGLRRGLALDLAELHVIRDHFIATGRPPTDAELETLAQTWSEHCAHKSFRADVVLDDGTVLESLLDQLRRSTNDIAAPFVVSAFDGNAGIVQFNDALTYALKCETHNHPSAIEPFGGANTGVGGVIRDILGAAHQPIACTDILCFGPAGTPDAQLPDGVLTPDRIIAGVIAGIADYGNKIGLPTVAGSVLYDPAYISNPLVFAGCIGIAPANRAPLTGPHPHDRVIMFGGRTGRDGIRGATFSSMEMDASTGDVAGASVQIGDPITEKLCSDLLADAWHLYSAITDCGAGGLSSAVGELADGVGADVDLFRVPLKYAGLAPWEIWLSEAQERMVVAVAPHQLPAFEALARRHGVELSDLGSFTGDGQLVVRYEGEVVVDLPTQFLHKGRPRRRLQATMPHPARDASDETVPACADARAALLALLAHPNIASKAAVIRRYDHEVLGATVVRPLTGVCNDGPADGVVLADPSDIDGIAIGIGVNPWFGVSDPEHMAWAVIDEAIRNVVVAGADPSAVALMDNFSWGNPTRATTFGELVASVRGCCDAARHYGAPFVSGKDSLNNEYLAADGKRHAIPPTLVITAVAPVPDAGAVITSDLKGVGNALVLLGRTRSEFGGSHLSMITGDAATRAVPAPNLTSPSLYRALHQEIRAARVVAAHDCSEGGVAVAIAEMAIGGRLGVQIDPATIHADLVSALFSESTGRLVCEVHPDHVDQFIANLDAAVGTPCAVAIGYVTDTSILSIDGAFDIDVQQLVDSFNGTGR
jgi:phosphoribosylformylglycinamidine synthase